MGDTPKTVERLRKVGESLASFTSSLTSLRARLTSTDHAPANGAAQSEQVSENLKDKSEEPEDVDFRDLKTLLERVGPTGDSPVEIPPSDWQLVSAALQLFVDGKVGAAEQQCSELSRLLVGERGEKVRLVEAYRRMASEYGEIEKRLDSEAEVRAKEVQEFERLKERVMQLERELLKARREAVENETQARTAVRRLNVFRKEFEEVQQTRTSPEEISLLEADRDRMGVVVKQLQDDLAHADQKLERLQVEKRALKENVESLERLTVVLRSDLSKCQARRVRKIELETLRVRLAEAKAEVEGLRVRLVRDAHDAERRGEQRIRERINALEKEAEGREKVLHEIKKDRDRLKGFILRYETELKRKERTLDKLERQLQDHSGPYQLSSALVSESDSTGAPSRQIAQSISTSRPERRDLGSLSNREVSRSSGRSSRAEVSSGVSNSRDLSSLPSGSNLFARVHELEAQVRSLRGSEDDRREDETGFWERGSSYEHEGEEDFENAG